MAGSNCKVLVVANPADRAELVDVLNGVGIEPAVADGGDSTLPTFEQLRPEVVVLAAALDTGDARQLAGAIRSGTRGSQVRVVLIGEVTGPIRNALDASDFSIDRFIARPLSPKALVFAVRQLADEVAAIRPARERTPPPPPAAIPPAPRRRPTQDPILAAMDRAINTFVQDAIAALDIVDEEVPGESAFSEFEFSDAEMGLDAAPAAEPDAVAEADSDDEPAERSGVVRQVAHDELTHKVSVEEALSIEAGRPWDAPPPAPPLREPTLILPVGAPPAAPAKAAVVSAVDDEYTAPVPQPPAWDGDDFDDDIDSIEELEPLEPLEAAEGDVHSELYAEISGGAGPVADVARLGMPIPESSPPAGGEFGRELRRKMSAMARRLFPGRVGGSVELGISHDAHTEIDLTALGGELPGVGSADTVADTNPIGGQALTEGGAESSRSVARSPSRAVEAFPTQGSIAELDVASLFARAFRHQFTGRLEFSRPPAHKIVHVVEGRPVFASSNLPHDRMGDLLYREGKITRDQHARSREIVVESGRRMGETLVDMGFLKPRELLPAVRRHLEDIIYSLFAWRTGEFAVVAGGATSERIRLSRHPAALVTEGIRRKYSDETLTALLGSADAVIGSKKGEALTQLIGAADLNPLEQSAVDQLDGERTLGEAAAAAGMEPMAMRQLAFALVALGVAEVVHRGAARGGDAERASALVGETDLAIDRQRVLAKFALVNEADYFMLLGVRRDASAFEIKRAYEAARRDYSRDNFPPEVKTELSEQIDEINEVIDEAYQVLRNDDLRVSYLNHLRE